MSAVRRIADLPRAVGVSPADQFLVWQGGRTRWTDLADVLAFVAAPAKGDKGDTGLQGPPGPKGEKGDTVISTPGGDVDLTAYAMKNAPSLTNPTLIGSTSLSNNSSFLMGNGQITLQSAYDPASERGRIVIQRANPIHAEFADLEMKRNTMGIEGRGDGFGGVTTMLKVQNIIGPTDKSNWTFFSEVQANGEGAGQHVAGYFTAVRTANVATFGGCFEVKDRVRNPVVGMVNTEFGMTGNGPCPRAQRININLVYGAADIYGEGDHVITTAIDISAPHNQPTWFPGMTNGTETSANTGRAILLTGMKAKGNILTGIDFSEMDPNFTYEGTPATGVRHSVGLLDTWDSGGKFGFNSNRIILAMPNGGLSGASAFPGGYSVGIRVNIQGYGDVIIPCLNG